VSRKLYVILKIGSVTISVTVTLECFDWSNSLICNRVFSIWLGSYNAF